MKKVIITILTLWLTVSMYANAQSQPKEMSIHKIKNMDKKYTSKKAQKRNFKTAKEFKHKSHKRAKRHTQNDSHKRTRKSNAYYDDRGYNHYYQNRQRGYRYPKRGWTLAYRYDRASFYDNEGYYYGFFNRHGYYFEDVFYRYDRQYSFRDRVKGKGLFSRRYYMPEESSYYGFCNASPRSVRGGRY